MSSSVVEIMKELAASELDVNPYPTYRDEIASLNEGGPTSLVSNMLQASTVAPEAAFGST